MYFADLDVADRSGLVLLLNKLHAHEIVTAQQYWKHAVDIKGINALPIEAMFKAHAEESMAHAGRLRDHIQHLGGTVYNRLTQMVGLNVHRDGDGDVVAADTTEAMLRVALASEEASVAAYTEACRLVQSASPATFTLLSEILAEELEHSHELRNLLG